MPNAPARPCLQPGCAALVAAGGYCPAHRRIRAPDDRVQPQRRGYDARWRGWRRLILDAEPLCRACRHAGRVTPAQDVDHIVPIKRGGTESWENLQPLCRACHNRKTARGD